MRKEAEGLGRDELLVLARLRLSAAAALAVVAGGALEELRPRGRAFSLVLASGSLRSPRIEWDGETLRLAEEEPGLPRLPPSLTLSFGEPLRALRILAGGRGSPLPLPAGPGALAAATWFAAAGKRLGGLLTEAATPLPLRARLLAEAALRGLVEVGSHDPWLAERLAHAPSGSLAFECPGAFSLGLEKGPEGLRALGEQVRPSARLSFADPATAVEVLGGRLPAVLALAEGRVRIGGLLPLVQALFAVLDRLGDYTAVDLSPGARS